MTSTWRDVRWEYDGGHIYCRVDGKVVNICDVARGPEMDEVGEAIVDAVNADLEFVNRTLRELFALDDEDEDSE